MYRSASAVLATLLLAACNSAPTAPTPPTGRLLTTAVWPGESVLVVSPEAAATPPESVTVTAGSDTMAFTVANDSTLAVATSDTLPSTDLALTVHTPGGFVDVGTAHVYGYAGTVVYDGFSGSALAFPKASAAPSVLVFDSTGASVLNVETGARQHFDMPDLFGRCPYATGIGPSYRSDSGWATVCDRSLRFATTIQDSMPFSAAGLYTGPGPGVSAPWIMAEIGPRAVLDASKYGVGTGLVGSNDSTTLVATFAVNYPLSVVVSPRGDRAFVTASAVSGPDGSPGLPVLTPDGVIAYTIPLAAGTEATAGAFSPTGDTLYVSGNPGVGEPNPPVRAYDANDGHFLDSLPVIDGSIALYADPRTDLLYAVGGGHYLDTARVVTVVERQSGRTVATPRVDGKCSAGDTGVLVAAPGHHALYFVSAWADPRSSGSTMGPLFACKFDVP
ncbi:MAG TPA: hypothetical protein VJ992_00175 [Gemmatimonadales bacterium]|nr:hypothetical protein [Gemmatimonadales bacterium]